jgi:hypothetical protein
MAPTPSTIANMLVRAAERPGRRGSLISRDPMSLRRAEIPHSSGLNPFPLTIGDPILRAPNGDDTVCGGDLGRLVFIPGRSPVLRPSCLLHLPPSASRGSSASEAIV